MEEPSLDRLIASAEGYEALLVPALFGVWAAPVADAARVRAGDRVLDVGCGTGVLTREVARRCGPGGSAVGLDPNPGMLVVATREAPPAHDAPAIEWHRGAAEALPFDDGSLDVVVSQFGLMFFADRERAVAEMLRVAKPDGRLAVAVWGALDSVPGYAAEVALLDRVAGRDAGDALRAPFALGDRRALSDLFASAGARDVTVRTATGPGRFPSIRVMLEADLRGWLPAMGVQLDETTIDEVLREAEGVMRPWATADGSVAFETTAHIVTAASTPRR